MKRAPFKALTQEAGRETEPESEPPVHSNELVVLLARGLQAAEGAQVVIEAKFDEEGRCPYNNDNYCRLLDWMGNARAALLNQQNTQRSRPAAQEHEFSPEPSKEPDNGAKEA